MAIDLDEIRNASRDVQSRFVLDAVLANPHHRAILEHDLVRGLPEPFLMAGSVYKAVWNALLGEAPDFGVNDYDLAYFNPDDLTETSEAAIEVSIADAFRERGIEVEACNQARVHIWFNRKFGTRREALSSSLEAVEKFASRTHAIGLFVGANGQPALHAPFGFEELLSLHIRPAPDLSGAAAWNAKCDEQSRLWPGLRFERA
ncbi:nucleotidyltransferase family protein [Maricaulis sp.]|uniref:nucleotidyltransferase family protein n=1 Tax=Maricaulis sp. TaxID=1486257 RepID=UPI001B21D3C8|nr:nucleotidyltransferase family protein [Maricaulis sp.]MBO6796102.1 nucleotidyltransferase family protein [Maricaulis sp.]